MSEEVKYYSQKLWQYWDTNITENNVELSANCARNEFGLTPVSVRLMVSNNKDRQRKSFKIDHRNAFLFMARFTPISEQLNVYKEKMNADPTFTKGFSLPHKNVLHITMVKKEQYDLPCFKLAISDKSINEDKALNAYVQFYDFLSLIKVLTGYRDNYLSLVNSMTTSANIQDLNETVSTISHKMSTFYSESRTGESSNIIISSEYKQKEVSEEKSESIPDVLSGDDILQNEMESFVTEKKDTMTIDAPKEFNVVVEESVEKEKKVIPEGKKIGSESFTTKFLGGDVASLETIIMPLVTNKNSFDSFVNLLCSKIDITKEELLPGCNNSDYNAMCYTIDRYIKSTLNAHVNAKKSLPKSVNPIMYNAVGTTKLNRSLLYDIFVYFMYYTQLNNSLKEMSPIETIENKSIVSFTMKVMMSPLIFSFLKDVESKEILVAEVTNRYNKYKDMGIFASVENKCSKHFNTTVMVASAHITKNVEKLYDAAIGILDKFHVESVWEMLQNTRKCIRLDYNLINGQELNVEQINSILELEKGVTQDSDSFNSKDYEGIPSEILKVFGIECLGPDNSNLKAFIENEMSDHEKLSDALSIVEMMTTNYKDLHDKDLDFSQFPIEVLVAFCEWNTEIDRTLKTIPSRIKEKVKMSKIDRARALSMLSRISDSEDNPIWGTLLGTGE